LIRKQFIYNDKPIEYEIREDNIIIMSVRDCALALGVVDSKILKDQTISITIRWNRVYDDLVRINVLPNNGAYKSIRNNTKIKIRNKLKIIKITQEEVVMWAKRVNSDMANDFIQIVSKLSIHNINNIIVKEYKSRDEIEFFKLLNPIINSLGYEIINQYKVLNYRLDGYIPDLNLAIEYDENNHDQYTYEKHEDRQAKIEHELGCEFVRVTDEYDYGVALGIVVKEINYRLYKPIEDVRKLA